MMPRIAPALSVLTLLFGLAATSPVQAQDTTDPLEIIARTRALCAQDAGAAACLVGQAQTVALMANVVAQAGNSRDRGAFIDPIRALLSDPSPELRTSALYALAKLGPDASDTPALLALARDPVSNVRAGAWAAAEKSPDPAARRIALRVGERPAGRGYGPDRLFVDPAALGFALPDGLEPLWLAFDLQETGQLHFLTQATPEALVAQLAPLARAPARRLAAGDPDWTEPLAAFLDRQGFADPMLLTLSATPDLPPRLLVVFHDIAFGQTGLAVVFADGRSLRPPPPEALTQISPDTPTDAAAFDAALLRQSGFRPEADPDESDLFMAIVAAGGFGAADYLDVYPDGAYAAEARAYVTAPRIELSALSFSDTEDISVSFANLPDGASAQVRIVSTDPEPATVVERSLYDATAETAIFPPDSRLVPGVYRVMATVDPGNGAPEMSLMGDFSVTQGQAVLRADKAEYAPGEPVLVRFSGMSGDSQDYISTALTGSSQDSFLSYAYTDSRREGSLTLLAPTAPGAYELRAFFREDESILRGRLPFVVVGGVAPAVDVATVPDAPPGVPLPEARALLALDKSSYAPGETITVTYADMFGHTQDYVTTVAAGAPYSSYLNYRYTEGAKAGTATLTAPTEPGAYEVRAFFMEDEAILRASQPFTVEGDPVTPLPPGIPLPEARALLALDKSSYAPGETITVTYADMFGHTQDYVATSPAGASYATYLQYRYTEGAKAGTATLTAPTEPGAYEVRAFFMEDEAILRASQPFTVR